MIRSQLFTLPPLPIAPPPGPSRWPLERPLIELAPGVVWRLRDAVESVLGVGMPGSGKTSSSGKTILRALLEAGLGGLFLCAKASDAAMYQRLVHQAGRSGQLLILGPGRHRLNLLEYLSRHPRPGVRDVKNIVLFVETILESCLSGRGGAEDELFWATARRTLLSNLLRILAHGHELFSWDTMLAFLRQAPRSPEEVDSRAWECSSTFGPRLRQALACSQHTPDARTVQHAADWWLDEYPRQPDKTRESVSMSLLSLLDAFNDPVLREVFGQDTTVVPEHLLAGGLLVVDVAVREYGVVGLLAQAMLKTLFQQCVERRSEAEDDTRRPVLLAMDEAHLFVHPSDAGFQATSRSSRCCTVALTQNLPNLQRQLGGPQAQATLHAWLGCFGTLVLHAQGEATTAQWMAQMCGRSKRFKVSGSHDPRPLIERVVWPQDGSRTVSVSIEEDWNVPPSAFRDLRSGGPENDFLVDSYVVLPPQLGHRCGRCYLPVVFSQRLDERPEPMASAAPRPWYRRLLGLK